MRGTERSEQLAHKAEANFGQARQHYQQASTHTNNLEDQLSPENQRMAWLLQGIQFQAKGLADLSSSVGLLAAAIRDVYDKLAVIHHRVR